MSQQMKAYLFSEEKIKSNILEKNPKKAKNLYKF